MENENKDVSLTTNDIRAQASNWTLAGDVGLLAHLEIFSQKILKKTEETQSNINDLVKSFNDTSTAISNVTNQFLALQNSQFVENRVYDDETPTEEKKPESKVPDKAEVESLMLAKYKEAVEVGVKILDSHFEEVQLPASSDSDDDDDSPSGNSGTVWRAKNPYVSKPFPLVIGSAEWWADDSVGLGEFDENVDSERVLSDSESDMEAERHIEKRVRLSSSSESESEAPVIAKKSRPEESTAAYDDEMFRPSGDDMFRPGKDVFRPSDNLFGNSAPNLFGDPSENLFGEPEGMFNAPKEAIIENRNSEGLFGGEGREKEGGGGGEVTGVPKVKTNKVQNDFTRELAAKLGSVAKQSQGASANKVEGSNTLFSPEEDDLFSGKGWRPKVEPRISKPAKVDGLFDERSEAGRADNLFEDEKPSPKVETRISKPTKSGSLFDDGPTLKSNSDPLFDDEEPRQKAEPRGSEPKKNSLFDEKPSRKEGRDTKPGQVKSLFEDESDDLFNAKSPNSKVQDSKPKRVGGLFEDEEPDGLFSGGSSLLSKGFRAGKGLFDDIDDIFTAPVKAQTPPSQATKKPLKGSDNLFDDLFADISDDATLFSVTPGAPRVSQIRVEESSPSLKFSTPTEATKPEGELFGDVSNIAVDAEDESTLAGDSRLNDGFWFVEDSRDLGFAEQSLLPGVDKSSVKSPTDELFRPSLTSSGHVEDTSDYKTKSHTRSSDSVEAPRPAPRMGHSERQHFSRDEAPLENDDLFAAAQRPKKMSGLFQDLGAHDDLFAGHSRRPEPLFEESAEDNSLFVGPVDAVSISSSRSSLFDDVSMGKSTLPAIFEKEKVKKLMEGDDLFGGKLEKVEKRETRVKGLFGEVEDSDDLFASVKETKQDDIFGASPKKKPEIKENAVKSKGRFADDVDDLFGEVGAPPDSKDKSKAPLFALNKSKSLFDDVGDIDDLLSSVPKKKLPESKVTEPITNLFSTDETDYDLFGKGSSVVSKKPETILPEEVINTNKSKESFITVGSSLNSKVSEALSTKENVNNSIAKKDVSNNISENVKEDNSKRENTGVGSGGADVKLLNEKVSQKPEPPKTLGIKKISDILDRTNCLSDSETDGGVVSTAKQKTIGKLNIPVNLNINVNSLLPGAKPKIRIEKEVKVEKKEGNAEVVGRVAGADVSSDTPSGLLHCSNKDRAKIPVRRRPQSRRARHEALRASGIDFRVETDNAEPSRSQSFEDFNSPFSSESKPVSGFATESQPEAESSSTLFHSIENSPDTLFSSPLPSNPLSPSTDEEDYFNVPELDVNFEKEDQSIFKSAVSKTDSKPDDLLFDGAPVLSPLESSRVMKEEGEKKMMANKPHFDLFSGEIKTGQSLVDDKDAGNLFNSKRTDNPKVDPQDPLNARSEKPHDPLYSKKEANLGKVEHRDSFDTKNEVNFAQDEHQDLFKSESEVKPGKVDLFHSESKIKPEKVDLFNSESKIKPEKVDLFHSESKIKPEKVDLFDSNNSVKSRKADSQNREKAVKVDVCDSESGGKSAVDLNDDKDVSNSKPGGDGSQGFFEDDESDPSDFFTKKSLPSNKKPAKLFDDDDDGDLFGEKSVPANVPSLSKFSKPRVSKNASKQIPVEKSNETFVDPLGLMNNSD